MGGKKRFTRHPTGGKTISAMSAKTTEHDIAWFSRDTGIPQKELRRMCLQAGLEQLQKGELRITAKPQPRKRRKVA